MTKRHVSLKFILVLVGIGFLFSFAITYGSKTQLDQLGIDGYYSQIEEFIPFALVTSDKLVCTINQSIYYTDELSNTRVLSDVGLEENVRPTIKLDLISSSGKKIVKIEGELKTKCASSSVADPTVSRGTVGFQIFATNQKGETVKVKDSGIVTTSTGNVDGVTLKLATWSITAPELENMIGRGSTEYVTTLTANAFGTIHYKEKPSSTGDYYYTIKGDANGAVRYKVVPPASPVPIIDDLSGIKQRKVELKLVNSDNAILDLRKANRLTVLGSLYDWEQAKEGNPVLSLYYTDAAKSTPSEKVTPIQQKTLTSYKGKQGVGNVADFSYSLYLGSSPKLGEYKVTFSSGVKDGKPIRDTVASITFQVIKSTPTCEETNTCPIDSGDDEPDEPIMETSDLENINECLKTGNVQCVMESLGLGINIIAALVVFFVILIMIAIGVSIAKRPPPMPRY